MPGVETTTSCLTFRHGDHSGTSICENVIVWLSELIINLLYSVKTKKVGDAQMSSSAERLYLLK